MTFHVEEISFNCHCLVARDATGRQWQHFFPFGKPALAERLLEKMRLRGELYPQGSAYWHEIAPAFGSLAYAEVASRCDDYPDRNP